MKKVFHYIKVFAILIGSFILFAILSCLLPNEIVHRNIGNSANDFLLETDYPTAIIQGRAYTMDNFTDAIILELAYCMDQHHMVRSVFTPKMAVANKVMCVNLYALSVDGMQPNQNYSRYWHGTSFLSRFFFLFGNYNSIRYFLYLLTSLLLLATCFALYRTSGWVTTTGFFLGFVLLNGFVTQFSLQFATDVILALIFSMLVCRNYMDPKRMAMLLFIDGCMTCYFDLLTTPIMTIGLPMIVYLMLTVKTQEKASLVSGVKNIVVPSALWGGGYLCTWFTKWILATILTPVNVLADGIKQTFFRAGTGENITRWGALKENLIQVPWVAVLVISIVLIILIACAFNKKYYKSVILLLPFMILPYCWYIFAANHSYLHCWFTYRNQMVTVSAWFFVLSLMVDWNKLIENKFFNTIINRFQNESKSQPE